MDESANNHMRGVFTTTETGEFGKVETHATLEYAFNEARPALKKKIKRFSTDGELLVEIMILTSLDNTKEVLDIHPNIQSDNLEGDVHLDFNNYHNNYEFIGLIGYDAMYDVGYLPIKASTYANIRNAAVLMCNPHLDYGDNIYSHQIDSVINTLRECDNEEIINLFVQVWDETIGKNKRR